MGKKLTRDEFIKKAMAIHGDLYNYSNVEYVNSHIKVCIIDPEYGEFWITPNAHLNGQNHRLRGKRINAAKRSMGKYEFIKRANLKFNYLYNYDKVEYKNCDTKVCIIDPEYGEFWQSPYQHLNSYGNPFRTKVYGGKNIHIDHIVPLSIVCSRRKGTDSWSKERPLYIFLDSDINKVEISPSANRKKGDFVAIHGKRLSCRSIRNNYDAIKYLVMQELKVDISELIEEDKKFVSEFLGFSMTRPAN